MSHRKFKKELKARLKPSPTPVKAKRKRVWWNATHSVALVLVLAILGAGAYWGHEWLGGRTVGEGLDALLKKSEAVHDDRKDDVLDEAPVVYPNCAALREIYPIGVAQQDNLKLYEANRGLDRNRNKFACEDNSAG